MSNTNLLVTPATQKRWRSIRDICNKVILAGNLPKEKDAAIVVSMIHVINKHECVVELSPDDEANMQSFAINGCSLEDAPDYV